MIKRILSQKRTLLYLAIFFTLTMVLYAQFVLGYYSQCFTIEGATNSLGLAFGYSIQDVSDFVALRSPDQLLCYTIFLQIWDTIFPVVYTLMYIFWILFLFTKRRLFISILLIHMIADWTENCIEIDIIDTYLNTDIISANLVTYGSAVTILKWSLSLLTYLIIIFGIIRALKRLLTKKK